MVIAQWCAADETTGIVTSPWGLMVATYDAVLALMLGTNDRAICSRLVARP